MKILIIQHYTKKIFLHEFETFLNWFYRYFNLNMDEIQHKRVSYLAETILDFVELKAAFFQKVYWTLELLFYKVKGLAICPKNKSLGLFYHQPWPSFYLFLLSLTSDKASIPQNKQKIKNESWKSYKSVDSDNIDDSTAKTKFVQFCLRNLPLEHYCQISITNNSNKIIFVFGFYP